MSESPGSRSHGQRVQARSLLSPQRFDVIAKIVYAKWRLRGIDSDWPRRLYLAHIETFNGFVEPDGSGKHGAARFLQDFDHLIDGIAMRGFDETLSRIPLATNGELVNGAHRLAACVAAGVEAVVETKPGDAAYVYDHRWFERQGLAQCWTDAIASACCELLPGSFVIVVYPSAIGRDEELEALIAARTRIWYRRHVALTDNGAVNLVQQIYRHERWVGSPHNDFKGAHDKKSWCFKAAGPVRVWLVESELATIKALKADIRTMFGIDNHSVHINDTHAEARELAGLLFNANSIDCLNRRQRVALPWFDTLIAAYAEGVTRAGIADECCIDGSGVLAAYGMRDVRDLDFLHDRRVEPPSFGVPQIAPHDAAAAHWYAETTDTLIRDPSHHFVFNGLRFVSLAAVRAMKAARGEAKDRADVMAIDQWQAAPRARPGAEFSWRRLYQRARHLKLRLRLWRHSRLRQTGGTRP